MYERDRCIPVGLLAFVSSDYELILLLRTALFWDVMQPVVLISYRRCGTTHRFRLPGFWILDP